MTHLSLTNPLSIAVLKKLFLLTVFFSVLLFNARPTHGYDNDTHFWLTYYLAVKSGYTHIQATQIASATISVDFDDNTDPITPRAFSLTDVKDFMQNVRARLHALPKRNEVEEKCRQRKFNWIFNWREECEIEKNVQIQSCIDDLVLKGQNELWNKVKDKKDNPGVFFHYLQDKYAHRNFRSYWGHACYLRIDFLASDPVKADNMARETVKYLREFMRLRWPERQLPPEPDWQEGGAILKKLIEANPSVGIGRSPLLNAMTTSPITNPGEFLTQFKRESLAAFNTRPDSSKARDLIVDTLKLSTTKVPNIWLYDLKKSGEPNVRTTAHIARYELCNSDQDPWTRATADETKNLPRNRIDGPRNQENNRLCLPWEVVEFEVVEQPPCRN